MKRSYFAPIPGKEDFTEAFSSAEEAWFWFVQAQMAKSEGARIVSGRSGVQRPCEPIDVFQAMERLYRARRLRMDHILVLRHYGRRQMSPDPLRQKEIRASGLWNEALSILEEVLIAKGIVKAREAPSWFAQEWRKEMEYA
jgi:hypothetical protein